MEIQRVKVWFLSYRNQQKSHLRSSLSSLHLSSSHHSHRETEDSTASIDHVSPSRRRDGLPFASPNFHFSVTGELVFPSLASKMLFWLLN